RKGADTGGSGNFDPYAPGEPGDYPLPPRDGPLIQDRQNSSHLTTAVLLPLTASSLVLIPTLATGSLAGVARDVVVVEPARPAAADAWIGRPRQTDTPLASKSAGGLDRWASSESELIALGESRKRDLPNMRSADSVDQLASRDVFSTIAL